MAFTSDDLVTAVRRLAYLPDASDITATDILALADEEMLTIVDEVIKTQRGAHWLTYEDTTLSANVLSYRLPRRALGRMVVGVQIISSGQVIYGAPEVDPIIGWQGMPTGATAGITAGVYSFVDDSIVFPAPPYASWVLRVYYLRRPSQLVPTAAACAITTALTSLTFTMTGTPPSTLTTSGAIADIVLGDAPYSITYTDRIVASYSGGSGGTLTLNGTTPVDTGQVSQRSTKDWLCLRDQTVFPQCPQEAHPLLYALVARRILDELGDNQGVARMDATVARRRAAAENIISPRNEAGSRPIVKRNSPLRSGGGGGRRWRA